MLHQGIVKLAGLALAACALAACGSQGSKAAQTAAPSGATAAYSAAANGRAIFRTGRDLDGHPILAASRPLKPACAACHGMNGSGGLHIADHAVSADLRHKALVTDQKPPYTLALLERAISRGIDNTGQPLNSVMPRWRMSARDLHDVSAYVLTLK
ncbi:MAG TPA: c-type cytochrome [Candidatus Baltobacteraceae bacterium]|nr:c-type cytochrome [Candidatus Baltobacteraceae bacterium]